MAVVGADTTFKSKDKEPVISNAETSSKASEPPTAARVVKPCTVSPEATTVNSATCPRSVSATIAGVEPPQQSQTIQPVRALSVNNGARDAVSLGPSGVVGVVGSDGSPPLSGVVGVVGALGPAEPSMISMLSTRKTESAPLPHAGNNMITSISLGSNVPASNKSIKLNVNVCQASDGFAPSLLVFTFISTAPAAPPDSIFNIHASLPAAGAVMTFRSKRNTPVANKLVASTETPVPPSVVRELRPNTVPELPFNTLNSAT